MTTKINDENKYGEVSLIKQQATKAVNAAEAMIIESDEDMQKATDVLSKIKTVGKMIKERKEEITKPLMEALNSARDLFKPIEANHAEAERIIKGKMLFYNDMVEAKAEADRKALAARVEKGTMKPETAVAKMENIKEADTNTKGKVGAVNFKMIKKYRVTDEAKLSRSFLMPDMAKITEALKAGQVVDGAEIYEEKVISAR